MRLLILLLLPAITCELTFGQAPYQRNSFTTNSTGLLPSALPQSTLELTPLMTRVNDGTNVDAVITAGSSFTSTRTNTSFLGWVALSGKTNRLSISPTNTLLLDGDPIVTGGSTTNSAIFTTNLTVQNNLTVSNFYAVNGNHNTLIVTNALTPSQVGNSKLVATASNGALTNADGVFPTQGSILYRNASAWVALTPGTAGYVLASGGAGANPAWQNGSVGVYRDQSIEAGAMFVGNLAAPATTGTYTNAVDDTLSDSWTFADAATQSVRFALTLPDVWNLGTVKLKLYVVCDGTNTATTTNLVWGVMAGSLAPLEAMTNTVFGTQVFVTNGLSTVGNVMQVFLTPAITVGGSPAAGDSLWFDISRQGSNSADTWTNTPVRLLKARVQWLESSTVPSSW